MKKVLILITALTIAGCSNLQNSFKPVTINVAAQEKIAATVTTGDLYAVGYSKIDDSGSLIAEGKARKQAKENLKIKISNEVSTIFNNYMSNIDENIRKVYSSSLADLKNYTTETVLSRAEEKISLVEEDKSYVALSVKKDDIVSESKLVFNEYTSGIIKKLEEAKVNANTSSNYFFKEEKVTPTSTTPQPTDNIVQSDVNRNGDIPSVEEDPLFQ